MGRDLQVIIWLYNLEHNEKMIKTLFLIKTVATIASEEITRWSCNLVEFQNIEKYLIVSYELKVTVKKSLLSYIQQDERDKLVGFGTTRSLPARCGYFTLRHHRSEFFLIRGRHFFGLAFENLNTLKFH